MEYGKQCVPGDGGFFRSFWAGRLGGFLMRCISCAQPVKSCPALCNPMDGSPPGSTVHGIFQAKILEWIANSFSRGSSWPKDWTLVSFIGKWILHQCATWEAHVIYVCIHIYVCMCAHSYVCMHAHSYVCVHAHSYACVRIHMYVCMHIHVCVHVHMYVCTFMCMYVWTFICMYSCTFICMCVCTFICMCVHIHMYACMHIHVCVCTFMCMYVCIYAHSYDLGYSGFQKQLIRWTTMDHNKLENSERDGNTRPPDLPLEKPVCRSGSNS